jgi:predicted nucleic acid-binding protein
LGAVTNVLDAMTGQRVYFDANVFVYFLDQHPDYFELVEPLLRAAYDGRIIAVTGDAVVADVMVKP